jgi:hypothetical protein
VGEGGGTERIDGTRVGGSREEILCHGHVRRERERKREMVQVWERDGKRKGKKERLNEWKKKERRRRGRVWVHLCDESLSCVRSCLVNAGKERLGGSHHHLQGQRSDDVSTTQQILRPHQRLHTWEKDERERKRERERERT